jgi:hypothetical protein
MTSDFELFFLYTTYNIMLTRGRLASANRFFILLKYIYLTEINSTVKR